MESKKNKPDRLTTAANISQIISLVLQVSGIILLVITVGFLSAQKEISNIPLTNIKLGAWFQLLLLFLSLFVLFQFYRDYYKKNLYRKDLPIVYWKFLLHYIPVERPVLLIPFFLIMGFMGKISSDESAVMLTIALMGLAGFAIVSYVVENEEK